MLKKTIHIFLFSLTVIMSTYSQRIQPLPLPAFTEATPIWTFRPEWEDYIGRPLDSLEYSLIDFYFIKSYKENVFIGTGNRNLEGTSSLGHIAEGIGVHCIDGHSGEVKWSNIYNHLYGAEDYVTMSPINVRISDKVLEIVDNRSNQSLLSNKFDFAYRRIIDTDNGEVLLHVYDELDSARFVNKYGSLSGIYIPKPNTDGYLVFNCGSIGYKDTTKFLMNFQWISDTMDSTKHIQSLYSYPDNPTIWTYKLGNKYTLLNDSTLLVLLPTDDIDNPSKSKAELLWIDIADIHDIHIAKTKRIDDLAKFNYWNYNVTILKTKEDRIYISDFYYDTLSDSRHTYLLQMDSDGEVISYIPDIAVDDNHYGRVNNILYMDTTRTILEMLGSKTGLAGSDILSVYNDGQIEFETSLTTGHGWDDDFRAVSLRELGKITDDGILILPRIVVQKVPVNGFLWDNTTHYIVAWDVRDLGIEWEPNSTTNQEKKLKENEISVYPNPTTGAFEIDVSMIKGVVSIELYDAAGRKIETQRKKLNGSIYSYDITSLAKGVYFVQVYDSARRLLGKKKLIKI